MHLKVKEVDEVHLQTEGVAEEHLSSPIITMAIIPKPSSPEAGRALTASTAFYNKVLSTEGDTFEDCTVAWMLFKKALLNRLWDAASKLEK